MVGICATASQYLTLILLVELGNLHAVYASTIGSIIGSIVSFFMNHHLTFKSAKRHRETLLQFYSVAIVGTSLNALLMFIGVDKFKLHYMVAQVITTGLVLIWNFSGNRWWTFRETHHN
jgi:putative flippase GtrA